MKTSFDQTTGVKTWHVERWYQKTILIIGYVATILFSIGFIAGILEELN